MDVIDKLYNKAMKNENIPRLTCDYFVWNG